MADRGSGKQRKAPGGFDRVASDFSLEAKAEKVLRELELFDSISFQSSDYECVFTMVHILTSTPSICIRGAWSLIVLKLPELLCLSKPTDMIFAVYTRWTWKG